MDKHIIDLDKLAEIDRIDPRIVLPHLNKFAELHYKKELMLLIYMASLTQDPELRSKSENIAQGFDALYEQIEKMIGDIKHTGKSAKRGIQDIRSGNAPKTKLRRSIREELIEPMISLIEKEYDFEYVKPLSSIIGEAYGMGGYW